MSGEESLSTFNSEYKRVLHEISYVMIDYKNKMTELSPSSDKKTHYSNLLKQIEHEMPHDLQGLKNTLDVLTSHMKSLENECNQNGENKHHHEENNHVNNNNNHLFQGKEVPKHFIR
jgi:phenylalanyl-tRNA synthetase alpha subunit